MLEKETKFYERKKREKEKKNQKIRKEGGKWKMSIE